MIEDTEVGRELMRLRDRIDELKARIEDLEQARDRQERALQELNAILA